MGEVEGRGGWKRVGRGKISKTKEKGDRERRERGRRRAK